MACGAYNPQMNKRRDGWTNVGGGTHKKHEGGRHVYRTSPSGRFIEKDQVPMTSAKGEHVVMIESAIGRPYTGYYPRLHQKAAALVESLVRNHGFIDGNKRTAFIILFRRPDRARSGPTSASRRARGVVQSATDPSLAS